MTQVVNKLLLSAVVVALTSNAAFSKTYPDLPEALVGGGGAMVGDVAYAGLGSAKAHFYALDLAKGDEQWHAIADFPGGERGQPVVAGLDGKLYVFGGLQKVDGVLQIINDVHVYDPASEHWEKLNTRSPFSLVGAGAFVKNNKIYMVGGVNLSIFNGYFQDYTAAGDDQDKKDAVMSAYFDQPIKDYFFNQQLFSYEPATNQWHNEGIMPFSGRAGAAILSTGEKVIVANGEVKPGLRTNSVEIGQFDESANIVWDKAPVLIAEEEGKEQEGLAGAYSGMSQAGYLVAGGANFPGARKQYDEGQYYAHKGLEKAYHDAVFYLGEDNQWQMVGKLPQPAGYGISLTYEDKVILIGGKNADGAFGTVSTLSFDGETLNID